MPISPGRRARFWRGGKIGIPPRAAPFRRGRAAHTEGMKKKQETMPPEREAAAALPGLEPEAGERGEITVLAPRPGQHYGALSPEVSRARQRLICGRLLRKWVPIATAKALALRKENRGKPVLDEEPLEAGLKAGAFVLKVLERLARLDGLDAAEKREVTLGETADPLELARRVEAVSPVLAERLKLPPV